jgi:hypothetical protein
MALDGSLPGTGDGTLLPQRSLDGSFIDGGLQERRDACGTNHFGVSRLPSVPGPSSSPALYGHGGFHATGNVRLALANQSWLIRLPTTYALILLPVHDFLHVPREIHCMIRPKSDD